MWQLNRKGLIRWISPTLALALVACSQSPAPEGEVAASSPAIVQTKASPNGSLASPESVTLSKQKQTDLSVRASDQPTSAASTPFGKPIDKQNTPNTPQSVKQADATASQKTALVDSLRPTFWTRQRMAGFSSDGTHYVYLESYRDTGAGIPSSLLQVIDISSSSCVVNGCIETRYGEKDAKLDIKDAETDVLKQTWKIRRELKLTAPAQGTELPITVRSRSADGTEIVTVRLDDGRSLRLQLRQKQAGAGDGAEKAAMQLDVTYNGQQRSIDSLNHFRDSVLDYSIRAVQLSPDGKRVVVLITAATPVFEGTLGTTIVQGFEL